MKKTSVLLLLSILTINMFGQTLITLKVGDVRSVNGTHKGIGEFVMSGNAIALSKISFGNNYTYSANVTAIAPGTGAFASSSVGYAYLVSDVIPSEVNMIVGESYTYSPVVNSNNFQYETFTWSSNNTAVASVDKNGNVKAVASGKATITCKANGGNSFSSVVNVSSQPVKEITLNSKSCEMSVGGTYSLSATVTPSNATQKTVKWLSSNENIAQVDDNGNVTAIVPGYCSIYAFADDGSGKYDRCLITVSGNKSRGDVNNDGDVDVNDVTSIVKIIQGIGQ